MKLPSLWFHVNSVGIYGCGYLKVVVLGGTSLHKDGSVGT
jgi:hypothetical protein